MGAQYRDLNFLNGVPLKGSFERVYKLAIIRVIMGFHM